MAKDPLHAKIKKLAQAQEKEIKKEEKEEIKTVKEILKKIQEEDG